MLDYEGEASRPNAMPTPDAKARRLDAPACPCALAAFLGAHGIATLASRELGGNRRDSMRSDFASARHHLEQAEDRLRGGDDVTDNHPNGSIRG